MKAHISQTPRLNILHELDYVCRTHTHFSPPFGLSLPLFFFLLIFSVSPRIRARSLLLLSLLLAAAVACYCYFITRKHAKMSFEWGKKREKKTKSNDALTQLDSRSRCYFHFVGIGVRTFCTNVTMQKRKATSKRIAQLISIYLIDVIFIHLFIFLLFCCSNFFSLSFF